MYYNFEKFSLTVLLLIISQYASASIISVDAPTGVINDSDGLCSISEAIVNANDDAATYMNCEAGNGADTIEIQQDIILTEFNSTDAIDGNSGLPVIDSEIIINGNGFLVERDNNLSCNLNDTNEAGEFRLLHNIGVLTLQNIKLYNGCADGSFFQSLGGGILNTGTLSIIDSQFYQNKANEWGGALLNGGPIIEISNSTFAFNTANQGGALANGDTSSITEITNSTFSANMATSTAGVILNRGIIDEISNSSFVNNTSTGSTSVIQNNSNSTITNLTNSLFKNNSATGECANFGGDFNGFNNITDNSSSFCPGINNNLTASSVDPLADNGGLTMTHALLIGSEAINSAVNGTSNDQRGENTYINRDIGAYEAQAIELCSSELLVEGFTTIVDRTEDLIIAMECSNLNGNQEIDRIDLSDDIILTTPYENDITTGSIGLPIIETKLFLNGQGFKISRDENLVCDLNGIIEENEFRLLQNEDELSLHNVQLSNGCIDTYDGGAIYNKSLMELINISIENNRSSDNGGGVYHSSGFIASIINSTFSNNTANSGAAMYVLNNILTISNSTFSSNSSLANAAIRVQNGTISGILNSSFVNNSSPGTSAIQVNSSGTISNMSNSLFSHNVGQSVCSNFGGSFEGANNMADTSPSNCPGTNNILTSSTIGPLADNGGQTMTHAILVDSEALDAGVNGEPGDQRGFTNDGTRDIGAYEAQIPVVTAPHHIPLRAQGNTTVVDLGMSTVVDADEAGLLASPNTSGPFAVGTHEIIWAVVDSQGHMGMATQTVTIEIATIGGTVSGLEGNNQVSISDGSQQLVLGNQPYTFDAGLNQGDGYMVNIIGQPSGSPTQTCELENGTGVITTGSVTNINIVCTTNEYLISGSVSGLRPSNTVIIGLNAGSQSIEQNTNDAFVFSNPLPDESEYSVSVINNPSNLNQTCSVSNGNGMIMGQDIIDVMIDCIDDEFTVSGNVEGLEQGYVLTVFNNNSDSIQIVNNGVFMFSNTLIDLEDYSITYQIFPDPVEGNCNVSGGSGFIDGQNIENISITCDLPLEIVFENGFE